MIQYKRDGKLNLAALTQEEIAVVTAYLEGQKTSYRRQQHVVEQMRALGDAHGIHEKQLIYVRNVLRGLDDMLSNLQHSLNRVKRGRPSPK